MAVKYIFKIFFIFSACYTCGIKNFFHKNTPMLILIFLFYAIVFKPLEKYKYIRSQGNFDHY